MTHIRWWLLLGAVAIFGMLVASARAATGGAVIIATDAAGKSKSKSKKPHHHHGKDAVEDPLKKPDEKPDEKKPDEKKPEDKDAKKPEGPVHCKVGVYVLDISNVDMKESAFSADFYLWMTWHSDAAESCDFELQNADTEERKESYKETREDLHYIVWRIKARLKGRFELARYPFDTQQFAMYLESPGHAAREVVFEAEAPTAVDAAVPFRGLDPGLRVMGWQLTNVAFATTLHHYETRFGYPFGDEENEQDYSRLSYTITAKRLAWPYFLRAFLPLLIVVGCACLLFLLAWEKVDVAMGTAITALLAAIALHLVEAGALPSVGYLVALDKFFIWSYAIVLLVSVEKVVVYRVGVKDRIAAAERIDRWSMVALPALYLLGEGVILILALRGA